MLYSTNSLITKCSAWSNRTEHYILLSWSWSWSCCLTWTVLENFSVYLSYKLKSFSLVEKLHEYKLKKILNVMIFGLVLRNTSVSSYRILLEDFPFLSLLLLEKINSGATNAVKCVCTERRNFIWEYVLVKMFCWRYHVSNLSIFKKITSVLHCCQRTTESSAFTLQGILQRK